MFDLTRDEQSRRETKLYLKSFFSVFNWRWTDCFLCFYTHLENNELSLMIIESPSVEIRGEFCTIREVGVRTYIYVFEKRRDHVISKELITLIKYYTFVWWNLEKRRRTIHIRGFLLWDLQVIVFGETLVEKTQFHQIREVFCK